MAYPYTKKLRLPLASYKISRNFLSKAKNRVKGKWVFWGIHLGEDINCPENTPVFTIGKGRVIYSNLHPGRADRPNWGNIIIIAHKNPLTKKPFFSLYGHLKKRSFERGEKVKFGQQIGLIASKNTPENGWWGKAHLHFGIYQGIWKNKVLPGYYKKDQQRTKVKDWLKPKQFIKLYDNQ